MNLDLNNSKTLTSIVIIVLILFAIIYVWMNKYEFTKESFINYPVANGDTVLLQGGLNNVLVGSDNTPLPTSINNLIQQGVNNLMPPLTIVSYYGSIAPTGWQLCDGSQLSDTIGNPVEGTDSNGKTNLFMTPNLQGRAIVGMTYNSSQPPLNNVAATYNLGHFAGEEQHTLTISEMPSHNHSYTIGRSGDGASGDCYGALNSNGNGSTSNVGGNSSHNNMQPYYVLNYIIKQPIGTGSIIKLPFSNTNSSSV